MIELSNETINFNFNSTDQGYLIAFDKRNEFCRELSERLEKSGCYVMKANCYRTLTQKLLALYEFPQNLSQTVLVLHPELKDLSVLRLVKNIQEWLPFRRIVVLEDEKSNHKLWYSLGVVPLETSKMKDVFKKLRALIPKERNRSYQDLEPVYAVV